MEGGYLVNHSFQTCILSPSIPCSDKKQSLQKKQISKLVFHPKSSQSTNKELKANQYIQKIPSHKKWSLTFHTKCKPPFYELLNKYDPSGMKQCIQKTYPIDDFDVVKFNENSQMLLGTKGDTNLLTYFSLRFKSITPKKLPYEFLTLMKTMKPIFQAISELETHNLIHNDIKSDNIVLHNNSFKLIDFELTDKVSKPKVFQERSLQEFYNNRLYFVYPLDYLFYSVIDEEIQQEIVSIYKRKHCDDYISIHNSFQRDTLTSINNVIETLLQESIPYRKIIKKIDVYSLGIIIPYLFLKFSSIKKPHKQDVMISDFYNLFSLMTDPLSNSRISSKKSYQLFTSLLEKYKMYSPTNITKKSRRRSTRRRSTRRRSTRRRSIIS